MIVSGTALLFVVFMLLWAGQTSQRVYEQGANALTLRGVLRTNVSPEEAEKLATRLRAEVPGLQVELVSEEMGRAMLALQEPWIAEMPDFEVTPLPIILEMHHPHLLTRSHEVAAFAEKLDKDPAVDFVAYNETAHDRLVKLATETDRVGNHLMRAALLGMTLVGMALCAGLMARYTLLARAAVWLLSWGLAVLFYRWWESGAISGGEWSRIDQASYWTVGLWSAVLMAVGAVINYFTTRIVR